METERDAPLSPDHRYDLSAWSPDARNSLEFLVTDAGVPFHWRDSTLVVPADEQQHVQSLISYLQSGSLPRSGHPAGAVPRPTPPLPQSNLNQRAGWYSRADRSTGWGWWDGTAWADHGGGAPPAEYATDPGWHPDPWELSHERWWDGYDWTGHTADRRDERPWFPPKRDPEDARAVAGIGLVIVGLVAAEVVALALAWGLYLLGVDRYALLRVTLPEFGLWAMLFGACWLAVHRHGDGSLRQLGLERVRGKEVPVGLLGAWIGRTAAGLIGVILVPLLPSKLVRNTGFLTDLHGRTLTVIVVGAIIVIGAPFFEELFFRGLVQSAFTRRWGARVGIFAQAGLFGLVHYQVGMGFAETLLTVTQIASIGIVLGVLRAHYQRLGPGMVAHSAFNLVAVIIALSLN